MDLWKLTGPIRRLAARSTPSTIAPLLLSAKFSAQFELNDFFDLIFRLAVADKNGHGPSIFAKAFEPILRHVMRDKPCDLFRDKLPQNDRTCQRVIKTIHVQYSLTSNNHNFALKEFFFFFCGFFFK